MEIDIQKRHQTMVVLWIALLTNIGVLFLVTLLLAPGVNSETENTSRSFLVFGLTALGTFLAILSFAVKSKILERAVEKQDVSLVQTALVVGCGMCEVSALLGLIERFMSGSRDYYLLFLVAGIGVALHFPRRDNLLAATYKNPSGGKAA